MVAENTFTAYAHAEQMGREIYAIAHLTHQRTRLPASFIRDALLWALAGWQVAMLAARHRGSPLPDDAFAAALGDFHAALLRQARHCELETGATLLSPTVRKLAEHTFISRSEETHARN